MDDAIKERLIAIADVFGVGDFEESELEEGGIGITLDEFKNMIDSSADLEEFAEAFAKTNGSSAKDVLKTINELLND